MKNNYWYLIKQLDVHYLKQTYFNIGCFINFFFLNFIKHFKLSLLFRVFMNRDLYSSLNKILARFVMTYKKNYPSKNFDFVITFID